MRLEMPSSQFNLIQLTAARLINNTRHLSPYLEESAIAEMTAETIPARLRETIAAVSDEKRGGDISDTILGIFPNLT